MNPAERQTSTGKNLRRHAGQHSTRRKEQRYRCFLHLGHWNALDITEVFSDAYEMLEDELLTENDFRGFTFTNAARLDAEINPVCWSDNRSVH